jgi:hypothetical protein
VSAAANFVGKSAFFPARNETSKKWAVAAASPHEIVSSHELFMRPFLPARVKKHCGREENEIECACRSGASATSYEHPKQLFASHTLCVVIGKFIYSV